MAPLEIDYSLLPASSNVSINMNGGAYIKGKALSLEQKAAVASVLQKHAADTAQNGVQTRPNIDAVAKEAKTSPFTVRKIEQELLQFGEVQAPKVQARSTGIGSRSLSVEDMAVLLALLERNPFRTRRSYVNRLRDITGTIVSESVISRFFLNAFPIRGSLRKPDMIPRDKFKPDNVMKWFEYAAMIKEIDPRRLKFGDEKLLKGAEVYCRKGRRNVLTGETPTFMVNGDFRNTYSIVGFCGIDKKTPPVSFLMHDAKNDAASFFDALLQAISEGFFRPNDVLVLDNAAIHSKGDNDGLEDWLWENHRISVVYLPTRAPELNPIELVWRSLTMKIRATRVSSKTHAAADAAAQILSEMTHRSIRATYRECKYIK